MSDGVRVPPGAQSRSRVLDFIRAAGQISRVELAQKTGLNDATISNMVRRMLAEGLVAETGHSPSTGGKPRTLLGINRRARHAVGVSLDHERQTIVVADLSGQLVGKLGLPGPGAATPRKALGTIAREISRLLADIRVDPASVVGIGVATPGPLDQGRGALRGIRPTPAWQDFAVEVALEKATGHPVTLENDATCSALGEYWTSRRSGVTPVSATVYMADGIGAGIIVDGGVFRGVSANVGEIGHVTLDINGPPCACGGNGCVEVFATPGAVVARASTKPGLGRRIGVKFSERSRRADYARIAKAAARGDAECAALITEAATYLAAAIVTLVNLLDLDEVALSGPGFADAGSIFAAVVQQELDRRTFARAVHGVRVTLSHLGNDAAALGAAALMLQQELTPHSVMRFPGHHSVS